MEFYAAEKRRSLYPLQWHGWNWRVFKFFKCFKLLGVPQCTKLISICFYEVIISSLKIFLKNRRDALSNENRLKDTAGGNRDTSQMTTAISQVRRC